MDSAPLDLVDDAVLRVAFGALGGLQLVVLGALDVIQLGVVRILVLGALLLGEGVRGVGVVLAARVQRIGVLKLGVQLLAR